MKPALRSENLVPYGGMFRVIDPATGLELIANTFESLMLRVHESRKANGIPVGVGIHEEFESLVCQAYPAECDNLDPTFPRKRTLTLTDIIHGTRSMLSIWWQNKPLVSREEAERRARICIACPHNTRFAKSCSGICPELKGVVSSIIDHQGTTYDKDLYSCGVCSCFLQASIWVDQKVQWDVLDENTKLQFDKVPNCWKPVALTSEPKE